MRAGQLRKRLTIQMQSITVDSYGERDVVWRDDKEVWGSIKPIRGMEYHSAHQIESAVTHRIEIRYTTLSDDTRITPNNRVKYTDAQGDRFFNIQSVINPEERNIFLQLMCIEET